MICRTIRSGRLGLTQGCRADDDDDDDDNDDDNDDDDVNDDDEYG
jgi:hypothetical protein